MSEAVLLDLVHGPCPTCAGAWLQEERAADPQLFLLCGGTRRETADGFAGSRGNVHVLDSGSVAERLFRFKQVVDELDLSSVRVVTSPRGRQVLLRYQPLLFTAVYSFHYSLLECACDPSRGPAHTDSPAAGEAEEVSAFLQQLPAVTGKIRVLKSTLIPDCFGHGFTSRTGGISSIPTLSSLNLFSSSRRRDPAAVVQENRRRLALHAGFRPEQLRMVKVNHGRGVWVLGKAEPENYDGMVTDRRDVVLTAPGADCMPLLFADPVAKVIGAAHAGWRGTLMGVAMATVEAMVTGFGCRASDILVAVGPSVGACCFTLERRDAAQFSSIRQDCVPDPDSARPHVDLRRANRVLLERGGVLPEHIHDDTAADRPAVTPCTSCHPEDFFSHRRDGQNFGTQVGYLWIREEADQSDASRV
ncbi:uncharacterized protein V6R79_021180 [Siganus canaliculatus]